MPRSEYIASLEMQQGRVRQTMVNGMPMHEWVQRDRATARKVREYKDSCRSDWFKKLFRLF